MDIEQILAESAATTAFKTAVRAYAELGHADRIITARWAPPIKVLRVIAQLLASEPALPVERVRVTARSGCADFVGTIDVESADETRSYAFAWDCAWRAMQEGWIDWLGLPDQIRAANEFGWRCFRRWRRNETADDAVGTSAPAH